MNELSLFTGAGGGLLGTMLLGFRPVGYVEWDDYCQRVIAARIRDGILPDAPIFGNIKTFIGDGYAESYQGMVDVITAVFPCQPFSVAGKQRGADDERNMWPATAIVIGIVKPRFVLLENVPGIRRYLPVVIRDLRRLGYEVSRPLILGADDVGAPHRRKRVWIVANSINVGCRAGTSSMPRQEGGKTFPRDADRHAANSSRELSHGSGGTRGRRGEFADGHCAIANAQEVHDGGYFRIPEIGQVPQSGNGLEPGTVADAETKGLEGRNAAGTRCADGRIAEHIDGDEWDNETEPWGTPWPQVAARLCRVSYGLEDWLDENWRRVNHGSIKTVSRQEVSDLWDSFQSEEFQRAFGRCYPLLKTGDVFTVLRQLKVESERQNDVPFEGATIQRNCMQSVFIPLQFGRASQRREHQEQFPGEPGDVMPFLSHEIALATESIVWWHGCETDTSNRVSRLKALGNWQIPIVVATAWRILTEGR